VEDEIRVLEGSDRPDCGPLDYRRFGGISMLRVMLRWEVPRRGSRLETLQHGVKAYV
jgi:hypothetical protein